MEKNNVFESIANNQVRGVNTEFASKISNSKETFENLNKEYEETEDLEYEAFDDDDIDSNDNDLENGEKSILVGLAGD